MAAQKRTDRRHGPTVNDSDMYEALRSEGNSKEKSARIANAAYSTSRSAVGRRGGTSPSYEDWTKKDLYNKAKDLDIHGRAALSKAELIKALRNH